MITATININEVVNHFNVLKQEQFTGQLILKSAWEKEWIFYIFLGRILYATGGNHPVRRLRRNLTIHCPQVELNQLSLPTNIDGVSVEALNLISWEYNLLYSGVYQRQIPREQAAKIIGDIIAEVLFDVTQAIEVTAQTKPENLSVAQLVLLDAVQAIAEVQQIWQNWQKYKIADRSPNRAPIIRQPEQLQQQTSPSVYQTLTKLLDGQRTLRDLAVVMKRDVVEVTCSLLPYIQSGFVELINIPDLAPPINLPTPAAAPNGPLIACVDDSPMICQSMEKILTTGGYKFLAVQDSLRAIATLLSRKPDLVFLDLVMPNTNGYEICSQLRKVSAFRNTPIIILTGNDGIIDRVRAKFVGSSGFLSKPIDAKTVLETARQHLNNRTVVE